MILTRRYIMAHRTDKGAWTRPQIEALGLIWPPRKGWIDSVVGREISSENQIRFESRQGIKAYRKQQQLWNQSLDFEQRKAEALERHKATQNLDRELIATGRDKL